MTRRWCGGEEGSGTVLGVAAIGVLLLVLVGGLGLASAVVAGHRARAAADLAALAAAGAIQSGAGDGQACGRAATVAGANAAQATRCVVQADGSVAVEATAAVGLVLPGIGGPRARATARAGPAPLL